MKNIRFFILILIFLGSGMIEVFGAGGRGFALKVSLLPARKPLVISLGEDSFDYSVRMENNSEDTAHFDAWINAELPDGSVLGPFLIGKDNILPSGDTLITEMLYKVPANIPGGIYNIKLSVGDFPLETYDSDEFMFIKGGPEGK